MGLLKDWLHNRLELILTSFTRTTETRISIRILIRFRSHDHFAESEFKMQLRYFTLEFEMLSQWCLLNCSNCYSFFWLRAKNDGGFEQSEED